MEGFNIYNKQTKLNSVEQIFLDRKSKFATQISIIKFEKSPIYVYSTWQQKNI